MLRALDLFCGAGGATRGLQMAGFDVTGVDIRPQPHYIGDEFHQADALMFPLEGYDLIWASPPCQHYTAGLTRTVELGRGGKQHPDHIKAVRERLAATGQPYIIENVVGAPLISPILLCGVMFGLRVQRHRLFESNLFLFGLTHIKHKGTLHTGEYVPVYNGKWRNSNSTKMVPLENLRVGAWSAAMGIDWMTQQELAQAIPPAYSKFLGRQVFAQIWGVKV